MSEHAFKFAFGDHHPTAMRAFNIHHARATAHGEVWDERHANAFRELHQSYMLVGLGLGRGRTAWPLAVGTGKTQSLIAFALAQSEVAATGGTPLSLLVCIERVDHIRDLYQEMVEAGVPASLVAVHHSKTAREVTEDKLVPASTPEHIEHAPFLIATHALMLRGDAGIAKVNTCKNASRSLVVWDESLIKSNGKHFDLADVEGALGFVAPVLRDTAGDHAKDAQEAFAFLTSCTEVLRNEFARCLEGGAPQTVALPELTADDETRFRIGLVETLRGGSMVTTMRGVRRKLTEFMEHALQPVRVLPYQERGRRVGVVHYLTLIPESLKRLIVLDASHNIRLLTSGYDSSLRVTLVDCAVKSFDAVTVTQYVQGAGRDKLIAELPRAKSPTVLRVLDIIRSYPANEGVIVATFKPAPTGKGMKAVDYTAKLRQHMHAAGIDPDAVLPDGKRRFVFLTWGQHVGISDYAYCRHVLAVGVLRRSPLDVAAQMIGQRGDLLDPSAADAKQVDTVTLSEMFHHVVQLAGRGACRTTKSGKAQQMTLTLLCSETFPAAWWQESMPGVHVTENDPTATERAAKSNESFKAVREVLRNMPPEVEEISVKTLKVAAGLQNLRPDTFSRLIARLTVKGWARQQRGFVRSPFEALPT